MTGEFIISFEALHGAPYFSSCGYSEVSAEAASNSVFTVDRSDRIGLECDLLEENAFNKISVEVSDGLVRYRINGKVWYEDALPSPANPWFRLCTWRCWSAVYRNLQIKGSPHIPRDVQLLHRDRIEGWITTFYGESKPKYGRLHGHNVPPDNVRRQYDWFAENGVIHGRRLANAPAATPVPNRLYYHRPLRNGDSITYEFYHEPDKIVVHPTLGRVAFLLDRPGIKLHWMTGDRSFEWTGLPADNAVDVPDSRRGPVTLPLKPGDWNSMRVSLGNDTVVLELNGVEIFQHPVELSNQRQFGFFHYKDRSEVQVRNVVLRGDWPEKLSPEQMQNMAVADESGQSLQAQAIRRAIIGEEFFDE